MVEHAEVGILVDNVEGNIVYFNDRFCQMLGYQRKEFSKMKPEDYICHEDLKLIREYHRRRINSEETPMVYEFRGFHKNGYVVYFEVHTTLLNRDNKILGTRNYIWNIDESKRVEFELKAQSLNDELTGLLNLRGFLVHGQQQIGLARKTGSGFYLIFGDLNGLKKINDTYGHFTGDRAIIEMGMILKHSFRKSDIIARVGGDEFVIIATEAHPDSLDIIVNRLIVNIQKFNKGNNMPDLSLSIGSVYFDPHNFTGGLEDLIKIVDADMYRDKMQH